MRARSGIALCYSLGGRFYEAEEILSGIRDTVHVSRRALQSYYVARHRMNRELYALTEPGERRDLFRRREHYYAVSAAEISEDTFTSLYYGYMDAIVRKDWSEASTLCDSLLVSVPSDSHSYAKAANHKAQLEGKAGRPDEELAWFIRSAMADIQSAVRDHGSLCTVSEELFNRGDVDRAMDYIRVAIRDTRFFNSPSRSWRDMAILPQIEAAYSERNARLHTMYIVLIVVILLFFVSAVAAGLYVLSRNRKLCAVQQTLRESNDKLNGLARSLRETNDRLSAQNLRIADANRIKEVYIGGFLQTISEYINKLSGTYQYVNKMLRDDRIAELRRECARSNIRNDELKEFYALFDKTFLGLFPSFIDEMNGLLADEARTEGRHDGELTTVLRIYALIRRGVFKSDRVSIDPAFGRAKGGNRYANWLRSMLARGGFLYEVLSGDKPIGFFVICRKDETTVDPVLMGMYDEEGDRGMGALLHKKTLDTCFTHDCKRLTSTIVSNNAKVLRVYVNAGATITDTLYTYVKHVG